MGSAVGRGGGGAGADWATCLRLLECAATAADVAHNGVASTAAMPMRVWGGCFFVPGWQTERDKKIGKKPLCHMAAGR